RAVTNRARRSSYHRSAEYAGGLGYGNFAGPHCLASLLPQGLFFVGHIDTRGSRRERARWLNHQGARKRSATICDERRESSQHHYTCQPWHSQLLPNARTASPRVTSSPSREATSGSVQMWVAAIPRLVINFCFSSGPLTRN